MRKGQQVQLISGGPHMTVNVPRTFFRGRTVCTYFNGGVLVTKSFPPECLTYAINPLEFAVRGVVIEFEVGEMVDLPRGLRMALTDLKAALKALK